jgi:hypothetical protein
LSFWEFLALALICAAKPSYVFFSEGLQVKKFSFWDVKLAQLSSAFLALALVRIIPEILGLGS